MWAGQVSVTVEVTRTADKPPTTVKVVLTQSGGSEDSRQTIDGHQVRFSVSPYPQLGKQIKAGDYRLTLTLTKSNEAD